MTKTKTLACLIAIVATQATAQECGLWLGPSPVKEAEDHGWGHSIFTGRDIAKGSTVLSSGVLDEDRKSKVNGDLFVAVYDWESIDMASYANFDNFDFDDDDSNAESKEQRIERIKEGYQKDLELSQQMEPPLFHQLWNGEQNKEQVLESEEGMRIFVPGLSTIAPCTWEGFNLRQINDVEYRDWRYQSRIGHDESPPSSQAGSFSYLSRAMFVADRDIKAGEELIVECTDNSDDFDPAKYTLQHFHPREAGGYSICLDDKIEERLADHTPNVAGGEQGGQRGLFAKKKLKKDEILTSSPMIPVHKEEMTMDREKYAKLMEDADAHGHFQKIDIPKKQQLLLNYMFGHPESSLLWLATAPLLHAANHAPHDDPKIKPNAKVQWHNTDVYPGTFKGKPLTRRQQFHHKELLEMETLAVALKHGMGLMMDLVATRDIGENEEILIDYGKAWDDAWKEHDKRWADAIEAIKKGHTREKLEWKKQRKRERETEEAEHKMGSARVTKPKHHQKHIENSMTALPLSDYVTAADYNKLHEYDDLRTITEQRRNPYPSNIETACYFEFDWLDNQINEDEEADEVTAMSWYEQEDQFGSCLLPCVVTERREYFQDEEHDFDVKNPFDDFDDDEFQAPPKERPKGVKNGGSKTNKRYTAKLIDNLEGNTSVPYECHIFKRFEYYFMDIPREGITFVNKIHSTDQWIDLAFRQPIGLPDDMVPTNWRDLSKRKGTRGGRKKKLPIKPQKEMTVKEKHQEEDYQNSIRKWNQAESRRDLLEDLEIKWTLGSPKMDL